MLFFHTSRSETQSLRPASDPPATLSLFAPLRPCFPLLLLHFRRSLPLSSLVFKSILARSLTDSQANRSTSVCVCVRARGGWCLRVRAFCECDVWRGRGWGTGAPGLRDDKTGKEGLYARPAETSCRSRNRTLCWAAGRTQAASRASNYLTTGSDFYYYCGLFLRFFLFSI